MRGFADKVAVVTGAGSGIGRALALELGRSGAALAISDIDINRLSETEDLLKSLGAPLHSAVVDVTRADDLLAYAAAVNDRFGTVNLIFNNAGVAFAGDIESSQLTDIERVVNVNFWGVVNGTKAFLPHLITSGDGHIVNISSLFGLCAVPGQAAYIASKFAVRGFTEALRLEMVLAGRPIKVTAVHPGGIKTSLAHNAEGVPGFDKDAGIAVFEKVAITSAERAAQRILIGVRKNKARVLVGPDARALAFLVRLTGSGYLRLFAAGLSRRKPA